VQELIDDAVAKGAQVLAGGKQASIAGGQFFQPTVITGINKSMKLWTEEVFGPVGAAGGLAVVWGGVCGVECVDVAC
jgi:succinate-semialdehyde dehydrogenase/glutarate-semialdehyde dehydrogenase